MRKGPGKSPQDKQVIGLPSKMWEPQFKFLLFFPPHLTTFCARWSEHCNPIIHNTRRAKTYTNEGTELKSTHFNNYSPNCTCKEVRRHKCTEVSVALLDLEIQAQNLIHKKETFANNAKLFSHLSFLAISFWIKWHHITCSPKS